MNSFLIKNKSPFALTMNESVDENGKKKYIFTGPFTPCDGTTKNRNGRIYDEQTVLPHLAYLRDEIKKKGCILGELDHPDNRFEVSLQHVSHKITDLWYDKDKKMVMGKLELLDTPNGKTMKAIVDAGCPLYVSSRAAGSVLPNSHVTIQQIFTYDIVSSPGFEECQLNRVNESMRPKVTNFMNESISLHRKSKENNIAGKFGILDENTEIMKTDKEPKITFRKVNEPLNSIISPILSEDIKIKLSPEGKEKLSAEENGQSPAREGADDNNIQHSASEILTIEPVYIQKDDIKDIEPDYKVDYKTNNDNPVTEGKKAPFDFGSKLAFARRNEKTKNMKGKNEALKPSLETVKTAKDDDGSDEDTYNPKKDISEKGEKVDNKKKVTKEKICPYCGNPLSKCTCTDKVKKIRESVDEKTKAMMGKYDSLSETVRKKADIRKCIVMKYPFSNVLTEDNFFKFTQLVDSDKRLCADWIWRNQIYNPEQVNEHWMTPLTERQKMQKNYLKLADQTDIDLYNNAPRNVRDSIDEMAKCYILDNKDDVDEFWSRTGLRDQYADNMKQQEFIKSFNTITDKDKANKRQNENGILGMKTIKLVESLMNDMNSNN